MEDPPDRRVGGADETTTTEAIRNGNYSQNAWGRLATVEFADEDTGAPFAYSYRYLEKAVPGAQICWRNRSSPASACSTCVETVRPAGVGRLKPAPPGNFAQNSQGRNRCWCSAMSTRLPRNFTPSISRRMRCSIPASNLSLISPPAPTTRCQGREPPERCSSCATCRWYRGYPAAAATWP